MPRKFVTDREILFINSISRELHQDVVVEEIYYYAIMLDKMRDDDMYNEYVKKKWASPVKVSARIKYENMNSRASNFGLDSQYASEVYFHTQELKERNLIPREGDFIEYGQLFYEITSVSQPQLVFGQINNQILTQCHLVPAREGQFAANGITERNVDHTHALENATSHSRQRPDRSRATFSVGGSGRAPFQSITERVSGQRQLPVYSDATRPDPTLLSAGTEIFNSDAKQEQISDGTYWRDEDGNIVATSGVVPPAAITPDLPVFVNELGTDELLPSFTNSTRPPANKVPALEIYNSDANEEQVSDGSYWRDRDGNIVA